MYVCSIFIFYINFMMVLKVDRNASRFESSYDLEQFFSVLLLSFNTKDFVLKCVSCHLIHEITFIPLYVVAIFCIDCI